VQGVSEDRVLFGMTGPFTGVAAELGRRLASGIRTYFAHVNAQGGIAGRKLELIALDDRYEPDKALANVRRLDEEKGVFGYVGNVGAPTAEVTLPYALQRKLLFFGAFTGSSLLRKRPPDRYVFNYRPSLEEETAAVVTYLLRDKELRPEEIAVFSQNDSYGDSGFRGVERTLRDRGRRTEQIVHARYPRNTLQVEEAVKKILADKAVKAVVMVPTYRPAAQFIKRVRDERPATIFTSTAFVGSAALAEELNELGPKYADGVIVTQMTPPLDSHATLVLNYGKHLREHAPSESPNAVSLEGYLAAAVLAEGLGRAGDELTTETLVEALESIHDLDLGLGVPIHFSPSDHQAIHKVWAVTFDRDGKMRPLDLD
jgi:ABC-type branched-subunit amino acid transport system substrate-binding protein